MRCGGQRLSEGFGVGYAARLSKHLAYPVAAFVNGGPSAWLDHQSVRVKLALEAHPGKVPVNS